MKTYIVEWPQLTGDIKHLVVTKNVTTLYYELDKIANPRECRFRVLKKPFSLMFRIKDQDGYGELVFDEDAEWIPIKELKKPLTHTFGFDEPDHKELDRILGGDVYAVPIKEV